jgi:Ala-tRNA(Pro) deacylase
MNIERLLESVQEFLEADPCLATDAAYGELRRTLKHALRDARRELAEDAAAGPAAGRPGDRVFRRILVAVDESEQAAWAATLTGRLAAAIGARVMLVHVVVPANSAVVAGTEVGAIYEPLTTRRLAGERLLERLSEALPVLLRVQVTICDGDAATQVVQVARDWGADLIVIGTHARGRIANFLLGSTAEGVVRRASCPVMTISYDPLTMRKVKDYLDSHDVHYLSIAHSRSITARETASVAHVPPTEFAKVTLVRIDGNPSMVVLPATSKVDLEAVGDFVGAERVELAKEEEFRGLFPDCEPGAMPPFGNLYGMPVYVDGSLGESEYVTFNAGTHTELLRMRYEDFERMVRPRIADLCRVGAA